MRCDLAGMAADALVNSACGEVKVGAGCRTAAFSLLGAGYKGFPAEVALRAVVEAEEAVEERKDGLECTLALYSGAVARLAEELFGEGRKKGGDAKRAARCTAHGERVAARVWWVDYLKE